jgi:LysM repeat protein
VSENRLRVWSARFLAPAAFFFAAVVLILLVQNGLGSEGSDNESTTPATVTQPTGTGGGTTTTGSRPARRRFYRVREGDTLDSIAVQFDTTVEALLELNPGIDPLALSPRQRIRVR